MCLCACLPVVILLCYCPLMFCRLLWSRCPLGQGEQHESYDTVCFTGTSWVLVASERGSEPIGSSRPAIHNLTQKFLSAERVVQLLAPPTDPIPRLNSRCNQSDNFSELDLDAPTLERPITRSFRELSAVRCNIKTMAAMQCVI